MTLTIDAVYINGVLKPLLPLDLKEHQRVTIQLTALDTTMAKPKPEVVTFRGIWPDELADDLEQALTEIRAQSNTVIPEMHDRLIACEAKLRNATLLTRDPLIEAAKFVPTL